MKICKICGRSKEEEEDFYRGRKDCRQCQRTYILGWQDAHKARMRIIKRRWAHTAEGKVALIKSSLKHAQTQHEHFRARQQAYKHKEELLKSSCEECGSTVRLQLHHPDYDFPLQTETLCWACHRDLHSEMRFVEKLLSNSGRKVVVRDYLQFEVV